MKGLRGATVGVPPAMGTCARMEHVILVNERDDVIGSCEKLAAHQHGGRLHRAFSVLIYNPRGDLLLQERAAAKYHFAGLWSNTCCGHPRPGEETPAAARRRLREEFGFDADLTEQCAFIYDAHDAASGLTEREYLHIFTGMTSAEPKPDSREIGRWRWASAAEIQSEMSESPQRFSPWFQMLLQRLDR